MFCCLIVKFVSDWPYGRDLWAAVDLVSFFFRDTDAYQLVVGEFSLSKCTSSTHPTGIVTINVCYLVSKLTVLLLRPIAAGSYFVIRLLLRFNPLAVGRFLEKSSQQHYDILTTIYSMTIHSVLHSVLLLAHVLNY